MTKILISEGSLLTADGWIPRGYVWITGPTITALGAGEVPQAYAQQADTHIDARHRAVLPGLINGHTHLSQTLMRGLAGGRGLLPWLKELIWPLQAAITPNDMRIAAQLGLLENLRSGVTTVVDNHKVTTSPEYADIVGQTASDMRMRLTLALGWRDQGAGADAPEAILSEMTRLYERWHTSPYVRIANGAIALWRCSAETLQRAHELARRHNTFTHLHTAETHDEVQMALEAYGKRPIAWLADLGILDAATQLVHAVWIDDTDLSRLATSGATVIHCPVSNAVLGSGIAPVAEMVARGIPVRLGTDGPASNDTQDLFETLKTAVQLARVSTLDPTVLPPATALALATGGRVLERGGPADCIAVDLNHSRAMPVHDVASALTLCTHGSDVTTVIVAGELLMHRGRVLVLDEAALLKESRAVVQSLRARAGLEPVGCGISSSARANAT